MKEKSILFSGPMVRAILEGRKWQTRRVVEDRTGLEAEHPAVANIAHRGDGWFGFEAPAEIKTQYSASFPFHTIRCPFGCPGDRLWVREAWRTGKDLDKWSPRQIQEKADAAGYTSGLRCPLLYLADNLHRPWSDTKGEDLRNFGGWGRYRHARFMPRWASRITLEVTGVRVQRLQEITEADAKAEGVELSAALAAFICDTPAMRRDRKSAYRSGFVDLWESINGEGSWDANPWVWVIEFQTLEVRG